MSTNGLEAVIEEPTAVATGKDDEEVDVYVRGDIMEKGFLVKGHGEIHPRGEQMGSVGLSHSHHNAVLDHFHCREESRAKSIAGRRWHIRHGMSCGKQVSKSVSSCKSVKSCHQERMSATAFASPLMVVVMQAEELAQVGGCLVGDDGAFSNLGDCHYVVILGGQHEFSEVEERVATSAWARSPACSKSLLVRSPVRLSMEMMQH